MLGSAVPTDFSRLLFFMTVYDLFVCFLLYTGEHAIDISNGKFTWEVPERSALSE